MFYSIDFFRTLLQADNELLVSEMQEKTSFDRSSMWKTDSPCVLYAVLGSQGIVVKCTAAIFFPYFGLARTFLKELRHG